MKDIFMLKSIPSPENLVPQNTVAYLKGRSYKIPLREYSYYRKGTIGYSSLVDTYGITKNRFDAFLEETGLGDADTISGLPTPYLEQSVMFLNNDESTLKNLNVILLTNGYPIGELSGKLKLLFDEAKRLNVAIPVSPLNPNIEIIKNERYYKFRK